MSLFYLLHNYFLNLELQFFLILINWFLIKCNNYFLIHCCFKKVDLHTQCQVVCFYCTIFKSNVIFIFILHIDSKRTSNNFILKNSRNSLNSQTKIMPMSRHIVRSECLSRAHVVLVAHPVCGRRCEGSAYCTLYASIRQVC